MRRSDQRRDAVFACYQRDVTGRPLDELVADSRPFTKELAAGVEAHRDELDALIARHARGWALDRIAPLERNVMRVALYEMEHSEDVPTEVAIDEAVEIAKEFCGADGRAGAGGSQVSRLREISDRLRAIARELESEDASDERAGELAREAAELSAEAVEEANRRVREAE
jgi:N utilization substance protein B